MANSCTALSMDTGAECPFLPIVAINFTSAFDHGSPHSDRHARLGYSHRSQTDQKHSQQV